jgi:hypothetical protein
MLTDYSWVRREGGVIMSLKKALVFWGILFLTFASAFGWEVREKYKLGPMIEGMTLITSGALAGRVAFLDGFGVYVNDLEGGSYEKLFSMEKINFTITPRGIVYIGQGEFEGNFLFSGYDRNTLFMVSGSGSLVGEVHPQDFYWNIGEGMTEIASGPYQGKIALLRADPSPPCILIFHMERSASTIYAHLDKDIVLPSNLLWSTAIAFLPADFPETAYSSHFVLTNYDNNSIDIFDVDGSLVTTFPGIPFCEGLIYIPSGAHQGKIFVADMAASQAAIRNLDGSETEPVTISVGVAGIFPPIKMFWLKDRQQMFLVSAGSNVPNYLISRLYPGHWRKDAEFNCTDLLRVHMITDLTTSGNYYLAGPVNPSPGKVPYEVHQLDTNFQLVKKYELPSEYSGKTFYGVVYVPGATAADDRFLLTVQNSLYSFDANFSYPAEIIDLSGKINAVGAFCYDPAVQRYYMLNERTWFRVFDTNWNQLVEYDLSGLFSWGFWFITKITSGDLKGNVALLSGIDRGDNELYIVNFEYQIATDLLGMLSQDVLSSGIKNDLAESLSKVLENTAKSVEKKHITPAVNEIQGFQNAVNAQRGKGIPIDLADKWLDRSAEISRGLESL